MDETVRSNFKQPVIAISYNCLLKSKGHNCLFHAFINWASHQTKGLNFQHSSLSSFSETQSTVCKNSSLVCKDSN